MADGRETGSGTEAGRDQGHVGVVSRAPSGSHAHGGWAGRGVPHVFEKGQEPGHHRAAASKA